LSTLPEEEVRSGYGEIIKYSLIDNLDLNQEISELIEKSLQIKKKIVELDYNDNEIRNILNYGHTFGHVIEIEKKYRMELQLCMEC
jgi:3-dehydroquinate synthetase